MSRKTVFLIRHGKTSGNEERKYIGRRTDEPLSESGRRDVMQKAEGLRKQIYEAAPEKTERKIRICTSPMKRAIETADILLNGKKQMISGLTELDFGRFEGKSADELSDDPAFRQWIDTGRIETFPGGESLGGFTERIYGGFIQALGNSDENEVIVIVCHGGNIMAILSRLTGKDFYDFWVDNLGGYCLELETENGEISDISYHRIDHGDNT